MSDPAIRKRNRANKLRGYRWEFDAAKYMNESGFAFTRNGTRYGGADRGDLETGLPLVVQCKDTTRLSVVAVLEDAKAQAANAGVPGYCVAWKRRGAGPSESVWIMPGWLARELLAAYYLPGGPGGTTT